MTLTYNGNVNYVMNKIKELSKAYPYYYNFLNEYFIKNKSNFFKIIVWIIHYILKMFAVILFWEDIIDKLKIIYQKKDIVIGWFFWIL